MAGGQMEVLLNEKQKPEATEILQLISEMTQAEQQRVLVFMEGVRFAKSLKREKDVVKVGT